MFTLGPLPMFLCMFSAFCSVLHTVYVLDKYKIFSFSPLHVQGLPAYGKVVTPARFTPSVWKLTEKLVLGHEVVLTFGSTMLRHCIF